MKYFLTHLTGEYMPLYQVILTLIGTIGFVLLIGFLEGLLA